MSGEPLLSGTLCSMSGVISRTALRFPLPTMSPTLSPCRTSSLSQCGPRDTCSEPASIVAFLLGALVFFITLADEPSAYSSQPQWSTPASWRHIPFFPQTLGRVTNSATPQFGAAFDASWSFTYASSCSSWASRQQCSQPNRTFRRHGSLKAVRGTNRLTGGYCCTYAS